jgi:hypothetical protein
MNITVATPYNTSLFCKPEIGTVIDSYIIEAVPWLRQLVAGFSLWSPRFSARVTYVASVGSISAPHTSVFKDSYNRHTCGCRMKRCSLTPLVQLKKRLFNDTDLYSHMRHMMVDT